MSTRQYVIINADEASTVNFDDVIETSVDTLRYNVAGDETLLNTKELNHDAYTKDTLSHSAMLTVLAGEAWTQPAEEL